MSNENDSGKSNFRSTHDSPSTVREPGKAAPLEIQILRNTGGEKIAAATVKLIGRLDSATSPELQHRLMLLMIGPVKELVFDMTHLKFISSAGLRVLMIVRKQMDERKGQIAFVNMQPQIQEVFDIVQALPGVAVFKDIAEFDAYLAARQQKHGEDM